MRIKVTKLAQNIFNNQQWLDAVMKGSGGVAQMGGNDNRFQRWKVSSLNNDNDGAGEDETAVHMDDNKREDFATGLLLIFWDNTAMMMDSPPPTHALSSSSQGIATPVDDGTAGAKKVVAPATTVDGQQGCHGKCHGHCCLEAEAVTTSKTQRQ